jgi:hypothetical protein
MGRFPKRAEGPVWIGPLEGFVCGGFGGAGNCVGNHTDHPHDSAGLSALGSFTRRAIRAGHRAQALALRPKLITIGSTLNLFPHPVRELREIADEVGALLLFDAAHVCGVIAGGAWPNPLAEGAHLMTMSTYKSLGGPASGLIVRGLRGNEPAEVVAADVTAFRQRFRGCILSIERSRVFFSEEKKQKTFYRFGRAIPDRPGPGNGSFLVLFFKKEPLAS